MDPDLTERVVAFLVDASKSGWKISYSYMGNLDEIGRYEITLIRTPPATDEPPSPPTGRALLKENGDG